MKRSLWIIGLVVLWATGTANGQTTWYVADLNCNQGLGSGTEGDPFCNIQLGIDAAVNGDEVIVAEGLYKEVINLLGKAITVRSTDPGDPAIVAETVIDGFHLETSVITCDSGEGADTVLNGLTAIRGNPANGGGMTNANGSSPTVLNCTFDNNEALGGSAKGGGMYNVGASSPTVTNCTFSDNTSDFLGAGMYNSSGCNPTVTNCMFSNSDAGPGGGGMYNISCNPTLIDCTFSGGQATSGGGMHNESSIATVTGCTFSGNSSTAGGGINSHDSITTVTNCMFIGNSATGGGGMNIGGVGSTTVTNCRFIGNSATSGGGLNDIEGDATVTNCIFTGNTATSGAGMSTNNSSATVTNCSFSGNYAFSLGGAMYMGESTGGGPSPTVSNCIFWENDAMFNGKGAGSFQIWLGGFVDPAMNYCDIQDGGFPGISNIDADPLWTDPGFWDGDLWVEGEADYHLLPGSPVIDAADNSAVPKGIETDHDGDPRFVDDPDTTDTGNGTPPIVDIGAHELQVVSTCPWDLDGSGDVGINDFLDLLAQWGTDPGGPPDFDGDNIVGINDFLALLANWGSCP